MPYFTAQRLTDGLLHPPQDSPNLPKDGGTAMIANAVALFGGSPQEYAFVALTDAQYSAVMAGLPGAAYLNNAGISIKTLMLTSDQTSLTADGIDQAILTADAGDPAYTGVIRFTVIAPDQTITRSTVQAINGIATETLSTEQLDQHIVRAECPIAGMAEITIEGV